MIKLKLFASSALITTVVLLALLYIKRDKPDPGDSPKLVLVGKDLFITSQLTLDGVAFLQHRGVRTLVDIRPDGEEPTEPSSSQMASISQTYGVHFYYIPVPHGDIPDSAVAALGKVLSQRASQTVLYCHSGRRAVRTFALVEASRANGPNTDAICEMVSGAGFSAADLRGKIVERVSHRDGTSILTTNRSTISRN